MKASTISNVLVASAIVTAVLGCQGTDPQTVAAKKSLESSLVDPDSVQYKDVHRYTDGTVCGQYNAKNRMGGYTGFEPFIYWQGQHLSRSRIGANLLKLCSDDQDKVEVSEEKLNVDFDLSKSAKRKSASVWTYLYVDASKPSFTMEKRDAIKAKIKQVFEGRELNELEGDQLNAALLNAFASDKELSSIKRVHYSVW